MNEEVAKEDRKVEDAAKEVARIRDEEHIVDLNPEGTEDSLTAANSNVVKQEGEVNDAETNVATLTGQTAADRKPEGRRSDADDADAQHPGSDHPKNSA